jgi:integrase
MKTVARKTQKLKPDKPYDDFPLFAHANGQWAKKIRGRIHYFGSWADSDAALQLYLDQRDDIQAGRVPRTDPEGATIRDLLNRFLTTKRHLVDTREITQRTFDDYLQTCERIAKAFGKNRLVEDLNTRDFEQLRAEMGKTWGPVTIGNEVQRVRVLFNYAYDAELVERPIRFGPAFKRPSKRVVRKMRNARGPRMFEAPEIQAMLKGARGQLRTMILLGINCGFGNNDVGTLPVSALEFDQGWVNYPRPKTGVERRCPLWRETIDALQETDDTRPAPRDERHIGLVFITKYGTCWAKENSDKPVSKEMTKLLKSLDIYRPGVGFYALRHTFETIAGETRDQVAVDHIMGHARDDMASVYRERISDERLMTVATFVHEWLFAETS